MVAESHTPQQNPPNILLVVATIFIAVILAIAAFIFGSPLVSGPVRPTEPGLKEPQTNNPGNPEDGVACTLDAKICPDGTAVGRVPPSCEFAPCPGN